MANLSVVSDSTVMETQLEALGARWDVKLQRLLIRTSVPQGLSVMTETTTVTLRKTEGPPNTVDNIVVMQTASAVAQTSLNAVPQLVYSGSPLTTVLFHV